MAQPQRPIPPHAEVAYDFCDVLDKIAQQNAAGPGWAKVIASAAVDVAAAYFPGAAKSVLGAELVATHKSTAAKLPVRFKVAPIDVIDQAIERGRQTAVEVAKHGPDAAIAADIEQFFTALAKKYGVAGSSGASATLTDSGDQSKMATKAKAYDPSRDPLRATKAITGEAKRVFDQFMRETLAWWEDEYTRSQEGEFITKVNFARGPLVRAAGATKTDPIAAAIRSGGGWDGR